MDTVGGMAPAAMDFTVNTVAGGDGSWCRVDVRDTTGHGTPAEVTVSDHRHCAVDSDAKNKENAKNKEIAVTARS